MADSPEQMLQQTYQEYRDEARSVAGRYGDKVSGVLGMVDEAADVAAQARQKVVEVEAKLKSGEIGTEQATVIRKKAAETAEKAVQARLQAATRAAEVLPAQIEGDLFPPVVQRAPAVIDAKSDLRMALDAVADDAVPDALTKAYQRAWELNDQIAAQVLTSDWGRSYLTARLGAGDAADEAWRAFRSQAAKVAARYAVGADKTAFEALGHLDVIQKAVQAGVHLAKLRLDDAIQQPVGGSYDPAA